MYENRTLLPSWDALRLILSIDRYGGVAGAARALGVTHATISRRLARAEDSAGVAFFERRPQGLTLTDAGRLALDQAARMEPEVNALERRLTAKDSSVSGPLRITIPPLMMTRALSGVIADFATTHPKAKLEFVGDNSLLNLHQREADVALRVSHKPPETLWGRKLTDQDAAYYASAAWLAQSGLGEGDLKAEAPLISFSAWPQPIPKRLAALCPNIRIVARSDDMQTAIRMVEAGFGITRMPRVLGETLEGVRRVECLPKESYAPLWLLTHPDLKKSGVVGAFMAHVSAAFSGLKAAYTFPG